MSNPVDDVYIDLLSSNILQSNSYSRFPISFIQNQSKPILQSTRGYKLSIIRFSLNTETLPIFIPSMQSKNTTTYSITMEYNGKQFQQYMNFEPQNINPVDPVEYYYVYNYQYLTYLVNKCIASCLIGLTTLTTCPTVISPVISFDPISQKCIISLDSNFYGYNESTKINIYMNYAMFALFASLPAIIVNKNTAGMDYQLNNLISQDKNKLIQDFSTVAIWNPVSSVVFTSSLIPICESETPPIKLFADGKAVDESTTSNKLDILTDFIGNDLCFVPYIQYAPAQYRYVALKQNAELKNLDLQVYWQNKNNGGLKPIYMGVGGSVSVKLLLTAI